MPVARRDDLEPSLRREVSAQWDRFNAGPPSAELMGDFPLAWSVSDIAETVLSDVNLLDQVISIGRNCAWGMIRHASYMFPPSQALLDTLACTAISYVNRFEYRLDLGDLDEATHLATQALDLVEPAEPAEPMQLTRLRAVLALARADMWRYLVLDDSAHIESAIKRLEESSGPRDLISTGLLAECLRWRARTRPDGEAIQDLNRAAGLLDGLLDLRPNLPGIEWHEARWGSVWGLIEGDLFRLTAGRAHLDRCVRLAGVAAEHVYPSTAAVEAALLEATLLHADATGMKRTKAERLAAEAVEVAIAAGSGRYWYALSSALRHAEWALPRGWNQPATTSARIAYDIIDQAINQQSSEAYRRHWTAWLARATALAAPALADAGAAGPAVSRLEQARTRILEERFLDDITELSALPDELRDEVAGPLDVALRTMRDESLSRHTRAIARDEVLRATQRVRGLPGMQFFRWKLEPDELSLTLAPYPTLYLAPGRPHGVAILGGGNLGEWRSIPLPGCVPDVAEVTAFLGEALSPSAKPGARRLAVSAIAEWLGETVWAPVSDRLSELDRVWLVPCSYLGLLPVHAARRRSAGAWHYALQKLDIRYAVTARSLARAGKLAQPQREPTFVGVPQPLSDPARLEGAMAELGTVAQRFSASRVLPPENLTTKAVSTALRGAGYLHAACHGKADPADPLRSGLVLGADQRLTVGDLFVIRTGLELAVLSACETNVPDRRLPDEAASLATGVHLSGCRAVIASSWRVPDLATAELMSRFYTNWRRDGMAPPTALRQAQLSLATTEAWAEPYYWAGFSFLGVPPAASSVSPSGVRT